MTACFNFTGVKLCATTFPWKSWLRSLLPSITAFLFQSLASKAVWYFSDAEFALNCQIISRSRHFNGILRGPTNISRYFRFSIFRMPETFQSLSNFLCCPSIFFMGFHFTHHPLHCLINSIEACSVLKTCQLILSSSTVHQAWFKIWELKSCYHRFASFFEIMPMRKWFLCGWFPNSLALCSRYGSLLLNARNWSWLVYTDIDSLKRQGFHFLDVMTLMTFEKCVGLNELYLSLRSKRIGALKLNVFPNGYKGSGFVCNRRTRSRKNLSTVLNASNMTFMKLTKRSECFDMRADGRF